MKLKNLLFFILFCFLMGSCQKKLKNGSPITIIKVEDFLAASNPTLALNQAFAELSGPAEIQFPENRKINLGALKIIPKTMIPKLVIRGNLAHLELIGNSNSSAITIKNILNLEVNNLEINGNKEKQEEGNFYGVEIRRCHTIALDSVISNYNQAAGVFVKTAFNVHIKNSEFSQNGTSGKIAGDGILVTNIMQGVFENNECNFNNPGDGADGDGIQISNKNSAKELWFESGSIGQISLLNNICHHNGRRGIKIQRSNILVKGNRLYENGAKQIAITQTYHLENIIIDGNKIGNERTTSNEYLRVSTGRDKNTTIKHTEIKIINNDFYGEKAGNVIRIRGVDNLEMENNNFNIKNRTGKDVVIEKSTTNAIIRSKKQLSIDNKGKNTKLNNSKIKEQ